MKIALMGYGKMGKAIEIIAMQRGHTVPLIIHSQNAASITDEQLQACDVVIEFTSPHTAYDNVVRCLNAGVPVVCGSTGWLEHYPKVVELAHEKQTGLIYASNFSLGVNIFFQINQMLAKLMAKYDQYTPSVEEIHHTAKKDAPSGTAITIAEQVMQQVPQLKKWVCNEPNKEGELFIKAIRQDPAPGTHTVKWTSPIDDIEITHIAHNRQGFAMGALLAAEFLCEKKSGVYTMNDVLGF
jgi:4-hydroxy-tetrahydrodipicolinate reductase